VTSLAQRPTLPRQGSAGEALVIRAYERCEWYELALMRHGFTTERLMKLSRKIANDALRLRGAYIGDRFEDLVSRLQIVGLQAALRYDPHRDHASYGKNGGEPFSSYVSDVMNYRVDDMFRSKGEGFGDRRRGFDNKVELSDDPDPADGTEFEKLVDDRRRVRWNYQAKLDGQEFDEWMVSVLDAALSPEARQAEIPKEPLREGRPEIETVWAGAVGL
jgi:hypothetical protein